MGWIIQKIYTSIDYDLHKAIFYSWITEEGNGFYIMCSSESSTYESHFVSLHLTLNHVPFLKVITYSSSYYRHLLWPLFPTEIIPSIQIFIIGNREQQISENNFFFLSWQLHLWFSRIRPSDLFIFTLMVFDVSLVTLIWRTKQFLTWITGSSYVWVSHSNFIAITARSFVWGVETMVYCILLLKAVDSVQFDMFHILGIN